VCTTPAVDSSTSEAGNADGATATAGADGADVVAAVASADEAGAVAADHETHSGGAAPDTALSMPASGRRRQQLSKI
jgi:hypothetical protein